MRKGIKLGIIGAIIIIVGVNAFYLASPLFISTEIDEPLPGAIIIIVGVNAFYLASPLFISTEIDEPLPEGAEVPAASPPLMDESLISAFTNTRL